MCISITWQTFSKCMLSGSTPRDRFHKSEVGTETRIFKQISYCFFCLWKLKKQKGEDDVMWYHWRRSVNGVPESNLFQKKTFLAAVCGVDWELAEWRQWARRAVIQMKHEEMRAGGMERKLKIYVTSSPGQLASTPEEHCDPHLFSGWRAYFGNSLRMGRECQKAVWCLLKLLQQLTSVPSEDMPVQEVRLLRGVVKHCGPRHTNTPGNKNRQIACMTKITCKILL